MPKHSKATDESTEQQPSSTPSSGSPEEAVPGRAGDVPGEQSRGDVQGNSQGRREEAPPPTPVPMMHVGTPVAPAVTSQAAQEARLAQMSIEEMADQWDFVKGVLERSSSY